jgi:hypothetical protein
MTDYSRHRGGLDEDAPAPRETTVHLLAGGRALCGKPGLPGEWEPGHKWVSATGDEFGARAEANCAGCLSKPPPIDGEWDANGNPVDDLRAVIDAACRSTELLRRLAALVPTELIGAYRNDATVNGIFCLEAAAGGTRESALIQLVLALLTEKERMAKAFTDNELRRPTVIQTDGPLLPHDVRDLLRAALSWRSQGPRTKWTTPRSRLLVEVIDRLRAQHPEALAPFMPGAMPDDPVKVTASVWCATRDGFREVPAPDEPDQGGT